MQQQEIRVNLVHLHSHVRSVLEGLITLVQSLHDFSISVCDSDQTADLIFFDKCELLNKFHRVSHEQRTIYLQGFDEEIAAPPVTDMFLKRPLGPIPLLEAINNFGHARSNAQKQVNNKLDLWCDADVLLQHLLQQPDRPLTIQAQDGRAWWCDRCAHTVLGSALSTTLVLGDVPNFHLCQAGAVPDELATMRAIPYEQWVYWLARQSAGAKLLHHADDTLIMVERGIASTTHGRDFARLTGVFCRPSNVFRAADLTHITPAHVRSFLNASIVLDRVRITEAPLATHAPQPNATPNVSRVAGFFGRLLDRMRTGSAHVS